ncbi:hypothetical protein ACR0ST_13395 [Aliidiomarina sp. Khilg15.8]
MGNWSMTTGSRTGLSILVLLAGCFFTLPLQAQESVAPIEVEVAAYEFPPYYSSRLPRHLLGELLAELNQRQQRFQFSITEIRPAKRYEAIQSDGCCSLIFFESLDWGWREYVPELVRVGSYLTQGADRYVRIESSVGTPVERIGGVVGYHYNFAGHQNDASIVENEHNLYLADTHRTLINMLLGERLDMIVLSDEYIRLMAQQEPETLEQLNVLEEVDQQYRTRVLVAREGQVPVEWINAQLQAMSDEGVLVELFASFGLQDSLIVEDI